MKKLLLLPLVAVLLLSSCSSKFGIAKRKYTKGYYFSVTKSNSKDKNSSKEKSAIAKANKTSATNEPKNEVIVSNGLMNETKTKNFVAVAPYSQVIAKSTSQQKTKLNISASASKHLAAVKASFKPLADLKNSKQKTSKGGGGSDTNTILLVILCLFWWLNLIAVYLHQGKSITTDFWITLLLDILVIFGIVYSILVVLDIVTLA